MSTSPESAAGGPVYARQVEVVWRLAPDRVLVRRVWPNDGEDEAADLLGAAALVWVALDEPGTTADVANRLTDADQHLADEVLDDTLQQLVATGWIVTDRPTIDALRARRDEIIDAVESFGGSNVRVFGSVARGEARPDSDVDLLIDVPAGTGLVAIGRITEAIEALVPWRVDVVTSGTARGGMAHIADDAVAL